MNPRFRRFSQRPDIPDIRTACTTDSIKFQDRPNADTVYNSTFVAHAIPPPERSRPPGPTIFLGGGCLAPTRDETQSQYTRTYQASSTIVPKLALAPPDSDIIPHDLDHPPISTTHASLLESAGLSAYDFHSARVHAAHQRQKHFDFGNEKPNYTTTTTSSYSARSPVDQVVIDPHLQRGVSISFDKDAGLGPHNKSLTKRRLLPAIADAPPLNHRANHFDVGHAPSDFETTSSAAYKHPHGCKTERASAPGCSQLSDHGESVPKWETAYRDQFQQRPPIENSIDRDALRKAHFDVGYAPSEWPTPAPAPQSARVPPSVNLQISNQVFAGDGERRFDTTNRDILKPPDLSQGGPPPLCDAARRDTIYLGCEPVRTSTTSRDANALAGTGRPAMLAVDNSKLRGPAFARGGDWDRHARWDLVDEKPHLGVEQPTPVDAKWQSRANFEFDPTGQNKGTYETTYYKTICEPRLVL
jgi:hypothetical protein